MVDQNMLFLGAGTVPQYLDLSRANRHGLIAGATGTGKTVTLQILAEGFASQGVPVFLADVKGDLSGISQAGAPEDFLFKRAEKIGLANYSFHPSPVVFWDVFGERGHPIRSTVSEMGPLLLARLLELNETQEGALFIAFEVADDQGLLLLDLDDLRTMLTHLAENTEEIQREYGNVAKSTVGAIQRRLLTLKSQGGELFFGEPALQLADFMRATYEGRGFISVLAADRLIQAPKLYATVLLWLLSELFEELPEVGDPDKPKLVFFFDEAHLLFDDAPKALVDRIAQVVRLIRSKGVGVFFVTQNPADLPEEVLGQLGNRVQHARRAYTPRDAKAVRTAASTFRQNPALDTEKVITELGVGEALTSMLDAKGVPGMVERTLIRPPSSRLGPATDAERAEVMRRSPVAALYDTAVDRESAHEILTRRGEERARQREEAEAAEAAEKKREKAARAAAGGRRSSRQGVGEAFAKSVVRAIGSRLGREILRGVMGSFLRRQGNERGETFPGRGGRNRMRACLNPASLQQEESNEMAYKIEEIEGIGPAYAAKLAVAKITTTAALLKACATRKGREETEAATGVDASRLLKWANMADLMRIKGVGEEYSELLEAAGVDTVKELRNRRADNLAAKMAEVNAAKKLVRQVPSESQVSRWVEQAKSLDPAISY